MTKETKSLQNFLGLDKSDNLIDVKLSLGNAISAPSEIAKQLQNIIKDYNDGLLDKFADY